MEAMVYEYFTKYTNLSTYYIICKNGPSIITTIFNITINLYCSLFLRNIILIVYILITQKLLVGMFN